MRKLNVEGKKLKMTLLFMVNFGKYSKSRLIMNKTLLVVLFMLSLSPLLGQDKTPDIYLDYIVTANGDTIKDLPASNIEYEDGFLGFVNAVIKIIRYPSLAREYDKQGTVVLRVIVGTKGKVEHVDLVQKSGETYLDEGFVKEMTDWEKIKPVKVNGKPVKLALVIKMQFKLG